MTFVRTNNIGFKYQRLRTLGSKDKGIRKSEFVAKTQFLCGNSFKELQIIINSRVKNKILSILPMSPKFWVKLNYNHYTEFCITSSKYTFSRNSNIYDHTIKGICLKLYFNINLILIPNWAENIENLLYMTV